MGGLSCNASCMKYILFLFNIVFFITGAAILGLGIWLRVDPEASSILKVVELNDGSPLMTTAILMLIGIGAFIFIVGFLGCCGACKESSCLLFLYAGLLILVFILEITAAILVIVYKSKISDELTSSMQKQLVTMNATNNDSPTTIVWNGLQHGLKCCGAVNADDYKNNTFLKNAREPFPQTCCKMDTLDMKNPVADNWNNCKNEYHNGTTDGQDYYSQGCNQKLMSWIDKHTGILIGVGIGIAVIQLFGIIFALHVRKEINY